MADAYFVETEFFDRADALREQLEGALGAKAERPSGLLTEVAADGAYRFLIATADQVFSHELVLAYLNNLRRWAKERLEARHASTPQVHVYVNGCRRELAPDATPARWHYLYSLTRSEPPAVRLLKENGLGKKPFQIALGRITSCQLQFNYLLIHETSIAYALNSPRRATKPLDGAILLHGYLW